MKACVLIPTFDNARTLETVLRAALDRDIPVLVVDDGSTDRTPEILATFGDITVVRHEQNLGKGKALLSGMEKARELGFSHVLSMDADGQHLAEDIPVLLGAAKQHPHALILGNRDLRAAGAGPGSRFGRAFSNFWTFVETGLRLPDTQTGLRCYPLESTLQIHLQCTGYDFEIEVLVKAAWTGVPVHSVPMQVRYFRGEERVSHLRPVLDFLRIGWLNTRLVSLRICLPAPYLALASLRRFHALSLKQRIRQSLIELFLNEPGSQKRVAASVGLGLFMGIAPFWGLQIALTLVLAHFLNASKTVAVVASNISFPLMIPPILYASLLLGRLCLEGGADDGAMPDTTLELAPNDLPAYVLGSFILATLVASIGAGLTLLVCLGYRRLRGSGLS